MYIAVKQESRESVMSGEPASAPLASKYSPKKETETIPTNFEIKIESIESCTLLKTPNIFTYKEDYGFNYPELTLNNDYKFDINAKRYSLYEKAIT